MLPEEPQCIWLGWLVVQNIEVIWQEHCFPFELHEKEKKPWISKKFIKETQSFQP